MLTLKGADLTQADLKRSDLRGAVLVDLLLKTQYSENQASVVQI